MGLTQGGRSSYIGALAVSHASCCRMDLSVGLWNSAGTASLTALILDFIIILEENLHAFMFVFSRFDPRQQVLYSMSSIILPLTFLIFCHLAAKNLRDFIVINGSTQSKTISKLKRMPSFMKCFASTFSMHFYLPPVLLTTVGSFWYKIQSTIQNIVVAASSCGDDIL